MMTDAPDETPLYAAPVADRVSTSSPVDDCEPANMSDKSDTAPDVKSDTAPVSDKLRDAVEVWREAYTASATVVDPFDWEYATDTSIHRCMDNAAKAAAAIIEADREAVRAEVARAIEVELSMCAIANVEAPSEWIDGFEFAWKRVKETLGDWKSGAGKLGDSHDQ